MITLISVQGLDYDDLKTLTDYNVLPSINEYMELHKVIASPPFVYPYSTYPMLTGHYQSELDLSKDQKAMYGMFKNHYVHKINRLDRLKSILVREPLYSDRHTWKRAEKALYKKRPDFFSLTLETPELFRTLKKKSTIEQRSSAYVHIDYIVHRLYNIIGGHGSNLIIIAGAGKIFKEDENDYIKKLYKKKLLKKPFRPYPGVTLLNVPETQELREDISKNILSSSDFISYKTEDGFSIEFLNGKTNVHKKGNIIELENTGETIFSKIPSRLVNSELFSFTADTEFPMLLCHLEKIFNKSSYNAIISKNTFKKENLVQPLLINRKWKNIYQSTDVFTEIMEEMKNKD